MNNTTSPHAWVLNALDVIDSSVLVVHDNARDVLEKCQRQAAAVEDTWRSIKPEYAHQAYTSLAQCLVHLFLATRGYGDARIFSDPAQLSLYMRQEAYESGMIFHRTHRPDLPLDDDIQARWIMAPILGRYCMYQPEDTREFCASPIVNREATCGGHDFNGKTGAVLPYVMPVPGTWSWHS